MNDKDWLEDPLMIGYYKFRKLRSRNVNQNDSWRTFHFTTRLKLDGAAFFCRQLLGAASMPDDIGLPLLAHRQTKWYLDAFFFELMSAYDTLTQELNIAFAYDLKLIPDKVRLWKIKNKLPKDLSKYMKEESDKEWFDRVRRYRNIATHHHPLPTMWSKGGSGDQPLDYDEHTVSIIYLDDNGNIQDEKIIICDAYLRKMVKFISSVWTMTKVKFY